MQHRQIVLEAASASATTPSSQVEFSQRPRGDVSLPVFHPLPLVMFSILSKISRDTGSGIASQAPQTQEQRKQVNADMGHTVTDELSTQLKI